MRKISKIRLILCSALACFAVGCFAAVGIGVKAHASGTFDMQSGASVKIGTGNGLRFTAVLPASEYEEGAVYGMLIAPEDYVRNADLTVENVFGENAVYDWAVKDTDGNYVYSGTKTRIINIVYDSLPKNSDGDYVINGSVLSLKSGNIARNFIGKAYRRTGTEGSYVYEMANYANGDVANNTRSMFTVAKAAINGDKESDATKTFLESEYIDKCYALATLTEGDDHVKFFSKTSSDNGSTIGNLTETTDIPDGYDKAYSMYAQYGDYYTLFGGVNLDLYIRLKFMIKGTYTAPGIGYFSNTGWKEIRCEKNSDGVWTLFYDGKEATLQQKMTLSGSICITDLYGVKEDTSAKYYRVTFKDENDNILGYKSFKSGNTAELTLSDKDLGDGYTLTYDNVKWLDSVGGNEVDLSSVTEDMAVYFGGEILIYKSHEKPDYIALASANKYLTAVNGSMTFKVRVTGGDLGSTTLNIYENTVWKAEYDNSRIAEWLYNVGLNKWITITINANSKTYSVKGNNVDKTAELNFIDVDFNKMSLVANQFNVDLAAIQGKCYTVTYMDENGNVIGTEKVNEGSGATFVPTATTTDDGYTLTYDNVKWLDSVGGNEVNLSSVTEDITVYFGGEKITYVKAEKYDETSGYKKVTDLNKYIVADENGNIEFKIRLNGSTSGSFIIYEKTTWTTGEFVQGVDGNEWWTVKGDATAKSVTIYKPNGDVAASMVFNNYSAETMSIYLGCNVDLAAVSR